MYRGPFIPETFKPGLFHTTRSLRFHPLRRLDGRVYRASRHVSVLTRLLLRTDISSETVAYECVRTVVTLFCAKRVSQRYHAIAKMSRYDPQRSRYSMGLKDKCRDVLYIFVTPGARM